MRITARKLTVSARLPRRHSTATSWGARAALAFYACTGIPCDGLRINDKCQVYDTNHKTIGGLYAIGNCSGSFFSGNYPEFFVGVAVGRTMTQGRLAVKAILENA